jgi:tetratricopeptide (TPR) repeat protein
MSRPHKFPKPIPTRSRDTTPTQRPTPHSRTRVVYLALAVGAMLIPLGLWMAFPPPHRPPILSLESVDPKVATVLEHHRQEVIENPMSGPAWGWLGALLWTYDFRPEARLCLARAEQLDPTNPRWPYYHGLALMISDPNDAVRHFQRAVQLCGNNPEAPRIRLARLLGEQERWTEVETELEPLLEAKPDFSPARLLIARSAHAAGDLTRAIELTRSCTQDTRTRKAAWAFLAILLRQQGDLVAATAAAHYASTTPPDDGIGDPFEAEVSLRRSDARALTEQAHPLLAAGHRTAAAALIDRLLREHPEHPDTWLLLGRLHVLSQQLPEAEQALHKHLALSPRSTQGLFQLGLVLLAKKQLIEAADVFQRATELKPDFGPAHYNRGLALAQAGRPREAVAAFRETIRYNPERFDTYLLLADLHLRLGEPQEARPLLIQARTLAPEHPRLKALLEQSSQP